jgi:ferritin-like metal-binding protein YciE
MPIDTLQALFAHQLEDLHSAEKQLVRALPQFSRAAQSPELKAAFKKHQAETRQHVQRLEQALAQAGGTTNGARCRGMAALIKEGRDLLKQGGDPAVLDAALITAAQKIEHYEIAGYGSARTYADMLGLAGAAELLQQTLNEEGLADETLTELAEATLSVAAAAGGPAQPGLTPPAGRLTDIAMHGDTEPGGVERDTDPAQAPAADNGGSARPAEASAETGSLSEKENMP